ncbi:MAG TPA: cation-translocating P-type ATPase [Gammaproteobacteria bacterium]
MSATSTALPDTPVNVYADTAVEQSLTRPVPQGTEAYFLIDDIRCGNCALTVERALQNLSGIIEAEVNFATHRARAVWDPGKLRLIDVLNAVRNSGYAARPFDSAKTESGIRFERRDRLRRLGIAALFGMQVMTISIALYAGEYYGMEATIEQMLRWLALVLSLPVIGYAAIPFLSAAIDGLRHARLNMDVPVSLGLLVAFLGSVHATVRAQGDVYFDSVSMFVFLLLLARYFEFSIRARHARDAESAITEPPATAVRIGTEGGVRTETLVVASALVVGDKVFVACGEIIPADGVIIKGTTTVDESLLTGESLPIAKAAGDAVIAGSVNFDNPVEMRVVCATDDSTLAHTLRLMERARQLKPKTLALADKVAAHFVGAVLMLAAVVAAFWWYTAPDQWLSVTISVLVVTCPCALSLATPAAFTAAIGNLARRGLILTRSDALERLTKINRFVFDKTGTLTIGRLTVRSICLYADLDEAHVLRIAASLEHGVNHPIGHAFTRRGNLPACPAVDLQVTPGRGVQGRVDGRLYAMGSADFIRDRLPAGDRVRSIESSAPADALVLLADENDVLASFTLEDVVREDASALVAHLRGFQVNISILSGDRSQNVEQVSAALDIPDARSALRPEEKLAAIREMQQRGEVVAVAGDGINDAPVLAGADVSIAMGNGPRAAQASADVILLSDRLEDIAAGVAIARRTRRIVIQNLSWALAYNVLALPAAVAGMVPPWLAAIGMSLSSLVVVANSLRAGQSPRITEKDR